MPSSQSHATPGNRSSAQSLPGDIVVKLFDFLHEPDAHSSSLLACSQLCRWWRAVLLAVPRLWTTLVVHLGEAYLATTELFFARSQTYPLNLVIWGLQYDQMPGDAVAWEVVDILKPISHRLRSLAIDHFPPFQTTAIYLRITETLFPVLEEFEISGTPSSFGNHLRNRRGLILCPQLQRASLVHPPFSPTALGSCLKIRVLTFVSVFQHSEIGSCVQEILSSLPNLEHLYIRNDVPNTGLARAFPYIPSNFDPKHLWATYPSMKILEIKDVSDFTDLFLGRCSFPSLRRLHTGYVFPFEILKFVSDHNRLPNLESSSVDGASAYPGESGKLELRLFALRDILPCLSRFPKLEDLELFRVRVGNEDGGLLTLNEVAPQLRSFALRDCVGSTFEDVMQFVRSRLDPSGLKQAPLLALAVYGGMAFYARQSECLTQVECKAHRLRSFIWVGSWDRPKWETAWSEP